MYLRQQTDHWSWQSSCTGVTSKALQVEKGHTTSLAIGAVGCSESLALSPGSPFGPMEPSGPGTPCNKGKERKIIATWGKAAVCLTVLPGGPRGPGSPGRPCERVTVDGWSHCVISDYRCSVSSSPSLPPCPVLRGDLGCQDHPQGVRGEGVEKKNGEKHNFEWRYIYRSPRGCSLVLPEARLCLSLPPDPTHSILGIHIVTVTMEVG